MDRLTAMEAFVAVSETGSFTRAALRMRLSTPMVTLHVRRLEDHLGVTLFNRSTRRVDLTEEGRQFLSYARATLDAYATAEMVLRPGAGIAGRVRLDAPSSIGHSFIVPALGSFQRINPRIALDLSLGDRGTSFRVDGFDLVIRTGHVPPTGWKTFSLGTTRLICVASPDYLERYGTPLVPDDLNQHHCILYASVESPGGDPWRLRHRARNIGVRPPAVLTFNDGAAILSAAREGLGIAQNLAMLAQEDLRAGRLIEVLPDFIASALSVVIMGAPERVALPHVQAVLSFLERRVEWNLDKD